MSLTGKINIVKTHIETLEKEVRDLEEKQRKSSAPRARAAAQKGKTLLHELRKDIMDYVKSLPTTTKKKVVLSEPEPEEKTKKETKKPTQKKTRTRKPKKEA